MRQAAAWLVFAVLLAGGAARASGFAEELVLTGQLVASICAPLQLDRPTALQ